MALKQGFTFSVSRTEWLIVLCIALFPPLLFYFEDFIEQSYLEESPFSFRACSIAIGYSFAVTFLLYIGTSYIFQWLSHHFPWGVHNKKRLWREIVFVSVYASLVQFILITVFHYLKADFLLTLTPIVYLSNILFGLAITYITLAIFEGVYLFRRWRESLLREAHLREKHTKTQLANLRAQLDPHFMFNSLNVLSALIRKDPGQAEHFVDDFARVYRYVLEVKDEIVVTLKQELDFAEAYLNLQKIRFGEGLQVSKNICAEDLNKYILPLALQEVLNNAIKHNELSIEKPLYLHMESNGSALRVTNTAQLRKEKNNGTGTGLSNLKKRYALLGDAKPAFNVNEKHYLAHLPLIENDEA